LKLAVLGLSLSFEKGGYILKSLAEALQSLDQDIEVYPIGYFDIVLGTGGVFWREPSLYRKLYPKLYMFSHRKGVSILRLVSEKMLFAEYVMKNFDFALISVAALDKPGVVALVKRKFPVIFWDIDSPNLPYHKYSSILAEGNYLMLCYSKGGCKYWVEHGIDSLFLPLACATNLFHPIRGTRKTIDILFTGRYLKDREGGYKAFLYPLARRFRGSVTIVGSGWESNPQVKNAKVISSVPYNLLNKMYNMAKININIHRDNSRKCHTALNLRTFEVPGAGQVLMSDEVLGINEFFKPGHEIVIVRGEDELIDNIEKFLQSEEERMKIAEAGYKAVLEKHTILHRAKTLLKILGKKMKI
jgi:spore maturation protein CgeB